MANTTRRTFFKHAAALASVAAFREASDSRAAEPRPRFKYSICNETFQDWPHDKAFKFAAACGYRGVEIAPFTIRNYVTEISQDERQRLRQQAGAAGVELVGLHWLLAKTEGFHLTSPDAAVRTKTANYLCELAKFCSDLGGKVMVFGSPKQRSLLAGVSRGDGLKYAAEVLRSVMPVLEKLGVVLALEPLSAKTTNFITTAAEAVELAEIVASPHCKLLLDCLAMSTESIPIPDLIRQHASRLVHFHANDPNSRGPGMGKLDFVPILQALREAEYRGWVSVEVFDLAPGPEAIARESIDYMRKLEDGLGG